MMSNSCCCLAWIDQRWSAEDQESELQDVRHEQAGCCGDQARNSPYGTALSGSEKSMLEPARIVRRQIWRGSGLTLGDRSIPEETAGALTYNWGACGVFRWDRQLR